MSLDGLFKPNISEEFAIHLARRLYGLEVTSIKKMVSYYGQNFHIQVLTQHENPYITELSDNGYTLKIADTERSATKDYFDSMHSTMIHLNIKGLRLPSPVKNVDGHTWKLEKVPLLNEDENNPEDRLCAIQLLTFLPGVPVCTVTYTRDLLYQWGLLLAKYHKAAEDLNQPDLINKYVFWSLEHIPEIRKYMQGLDDPKEKLVLSVLDKYPNEITKNMEPLQKGYIHGDFNENNVLVRLTKTGLNEEIFNVDGILDLEDIHIGTYIWDLGVMLAYALLDCKIMDPLEGAGHALAGYLSLRTLSDLELSLLKICIESRLCQSLVMCAYTYRSDPNNTYLLTSANTGWTRLEQMCSTSNEDLLQKWREIQQEYLSKV